MRRNILTFGDRSICGDYGNVKSAGDLHIMDSSIRKLSCAGDINILNSTIKKVNCAGALSLEKSRIEQLKMAGSLDIAGVCQGEIMAVMGKVTAEYLECKILKNGFKRKLVVKGIENGGSWYALVYSICMKSASITGIGMILLAPFFFL
ncbi:MAG: hypothetical protein GX306_06040 [Clostridiales bacterium]|nr:hypothetical protein [Clostridiales bacterium]